jgi:hypothetical protein
MVGAIGFGHGLEVPRRREGGGGGDRWWRRPGGGLMRAAVQYLSWGSGGGTSSGHRGTPVAHIKTNSAHLYHYIQLLLQ